MIGHRPQTTINVVVLAFWQQLFSNHVDARNFFADYAAYAQFLVAIPLFIVGERIVSRSARQPIPISLIPA